MADATTVLIASFSFYFVGCVYIRFNYIAKIELHPKSTTNKIHCRKMRKKYIDNTKIRSITWFFCLILFLLLSRFIVFFYPTYLFRFHPCPRFHSLPHHHLRTRHLHHLRPRHLHHPRLRSNYRHHNLSSLLLFHSITFLFFPSYPTFLSFNRNRNRIAA